jgi:hypothetical protein
MRHHFGLHYPHVSNFDRTDRLAGCEERWGPGGREVDGRRVIFVGPLDGSDQRQETLPYLTLLCDNLKNRMFLQNFFS